MQRCHNCNKPFSWGKFYKAFSGWVYKTVKCDYCGAEHKITIPGRLIFVSLTIVPALLFVNFITPFNNFFVTLGAGVAILMIGSLFIPFFVQLKMDEAKCTH